MSEWFTCANLHAGFLFSCNRSDLDQFCCCKWWGENLGILHHISKNRLVDSKMASNIIVT